MSVDYFISNHVLPSFEESSESCYYVTWDWNYREDGEEKDVVLKTSQDSFVLHVIK